MKEWQSVRVPSLLKGILILTIDFFLKKQQTCAERFYYFSLFPLKIRLQRNTSLKVAIMLIKRSQMLFLER